MDSDAPLDSRSHSTPIRRAAGLTKFPSPNISPVADRNHHTVIPETPDALAGIQVLFEKEPSIIPSSLPDEGALIECLEMELSSRQKTSGKKQTVIPSSIPNESAYEAVLKNVLEQAGSAEKALPSKLVTPKTTPQKRVKADSAVKKKFVSPLKNHSFVSDFERGMRSNSVSTSAAPDSNTVAMEGEITK